MLGVYPQRDGSVLVDGEVLVCDLNRTMNWTLPRERASTVAGLLIHEALAIPDVGQTFAFHGFRFEVVQKVSNRLSFLKLSPH